MENVYSLPGIGPFFAGQRHRDILLQNELARRAQEVQIQSAIQRMLMEQQKFPLELEEKTLGLETTKLNQERLRGEITDAENRRRREAADKFFEFMYKYDDPERAIEYSGVPRKFAEKFLSLTPQQRNEFYDAWISRSIAPELKKEEAKSKLRSQEQEEKSKADFTRTMAQQDKMTERQIMIELIRAKTRLELAARTAAQIKNQNFQQYAVDLMRRIEEAKAMPENTMEQKAAKMQLLDQLSNQLDQVVMLDVQARSAAAQQGQVGKPDIGALSGGSIPVNPPVQPHLPGQNLVGSQQAPQQTPKLRVPMTDVDRKMLDYAQKNPQDPRSAKIIEKLKREGKI